WGFPTYGNGSHTYTPYGYPAQTANFGATTYDWGNMPNELTDTSSQAEIDAVSTLLWHCGVSV
ncbi:MAG: C10 family peptidase, partial [Bacteroidales bacterium]|nr:C10 family peptidase [Bacteroidales bacterium]